MGSNHIPHESADNAKVAPGSKRFFDFATDRYVAHLKEYAATVYPVPGIIFTVKEEKKNMYVSINFLVPEGAT